MGRSVSQSWKDRLQGSRLQRVVRLARDTEITIVAERRRGRSGGSMGSS
jgi:hypothetical protein